MFKVNNKRHQNDTHDFILMFLLLTWNMFYIFFIASVVDFKQVNNCLVA